MNKKIKILSADIDNISKQALLKKLENGGVLFTPNVDHLMKLHRDTDFQQIYRQADYIVCDSKIVYWAAKFLGKKIKEKISGSDFFPSFCQYYKNNPNIKIFLLGGTEESVEIAKANINHKLSNPIVVGGYSPPIGFENDEEENRKIIDLINKSSATVLAIGVGAPKQEKWICRHKHKLTKVKIFMAVGATINFEAGREKRSPKWMSEAGLEWLYRMVHNPRRLWRRYLIDGLPFFWLILLQKLNLYNNNGLQAENQCIRSKNSLFKYKNEE